MYPIYHYDQVYYVKAPEGRYMNPVAIKPEIYKTKIQWLDTSRKTVIRLGQVKNLNSFDEIPPDYIEIIDEYGEHITLIKLTLDIYNGKVKSRVMIPPSFNSDEEVQRFYLESNFELGS